MTGPSRKQMMAALKAHARMPITNASIDAHARSVETESDRGAIIITAAMIEDTLTQAIRSKMAHLNSKELSDLFDYSGPMGTFSAKIKSAQAIGIIDRATRSHIEVIKEMRNACAHSQQPLTFADNELRDAVFSMLTEDAVASYDGDVDYIRKSFVLMAAFFAHIIVEGDVRKGVAKASAIIEGMMAQPRNDTDS